MAILDTDLRRTWIFGVGAERATHIAVIDGVPSKLRSTFRRRWRRAWHFGIWHFACRHVRSRRPGHRGEIRCLVVTEPYAAIGDEPIGGGDRVAPAQRAIQRKIDTRKAGGTVAVAGAVGAQRLPIGK